MKIGIIKERKNPPDSRVPITPKQCAGLIQTHAFDIAIEPSDSRCFTDEEYNKQDVPQSSEMEAFDVLLGVKEVPIEHLIPNKTYFFFSHTIKKQAYNRPLIKALLAKNIRMIDYETITNDKGQRVIAFGFFAGMVGAHNGMMAYSRKTKKFDLPQMIECHDYDHALGLYDEITWPKMKIVLTGTGRVGQGAHKVLSDMGIREVQPEAFLNETFDEAVFCQLSSAQYVAPKDGTLFDRNTYHQHPEQYRSIFEPYTHVADVFINGIYWDNKAPAFFTKEEMKAADFSISVIADVTCDIAPVSSVPSTLKPSTIADPVYGYDPNAEQVVAPYQPDCIDVMAIDNLPNELPRDASQGFGKMFIQHVYPELVKEYCDGIKSDMLDRATICQDGKLTAHFDYLSDFAYGNEEY